MTVQPTEQCVHTFLRIVACAPGGGGGPAATLRTPVSGSVPCAASPPTARQERRRKLRRLSSPSELMASAEASVRPQDWRSALLISMDSLRWVTVHPVERLDV